MDTNDSTIGYNVRKSFLENIINICICFTEGKDTQNRKMATRMVTIIIRYEWNGRLNEYILKFLTIILALTI